MDRQTPHLAATDHPPRLLSQVGARLRTKHYRIRTERAYCDWVKRSCRFTTSATPRKWGWLKSRHFSRTWRLPGGLPPPRKTRPRARCCSCIKKFCTSISLGWTISSGPRRPQRLPVVLTPSETKRVLDQLEGTRWLMASLLYGGGSTSAIAEPSPRTRQRAKNRSPRPDRPE